ncbi:hypothetical protein [Rhizobium tumorigenes]|uniref:Curlin n=1 Tax=Rhizobium tumorigenes TaxID=2041385 RepID=A0AAF1KRV6_9HYPH|nr:hypothetical protein [Rhizobium tumorigenes]WFR94975.1 hypothetical protein PR017_14365 [Rhizobium tumorigenes]
MPGVFSRIGTIFAAAALCGTLTLPVLANDYHSQGRTIFHQRAHAPGFRDRESGGHRFYAHDRRPREGRSRFDDNGYRSDAPERQFTNGHMRGNHLRMLASRDFSTRRGGGIAVIESRQPDYDFISNYAGSVDVYHANGGTYITGYGDGGYTGSSAPVMAPRAKIIDVARTRNGCAYENGVCVIRP